MPDELRPDINQPTQPTIDINPQAHYEESQPRQENTFSPTNQSLSPNVQPNFMQQTKQEDITNNSQSVAPIKSNKKRWIIISAIIAFIILCSVVAITIFVVLPKIKTTPSDGPDMSGYESLKAGAYEIQVALESYYANNKVYPTDLNVLDKSEIPTISSAVSLTNYVYKVSSDKLSYSLYFFPSGEDLEDSHIVSMDGKKYYQLTSPGLNGANLDNGTNSSDFEKKSNIHEIQNALELYFADNDSYPALPDELTKTNPPLLASVPDKNIYIYSPKNSNKTYTLKFLLGNQNDAGDNIISFEGKKYYQLINKQ